ncbi:MAG TPA: ABC transporter substrate-binding protein [Ignavibacteriaceae bacterium]|nr:ABC transporter substrate-binding protein [Ignavibacteriaceae bacterium]
MYRIRFIILFLFIFLHWVSFAQVNNYNRNIEREFQVALSFYNSENFNEALRLFDRIIDSPEYNNKITPSFLFKGKILLKQGKYSDAMNTLNQFLNIYSESKYADEARVIIAKVYINQENYPDAFESLARIISSAESPSYLDEAKSLCEKISLNYLLPGQLDYYYNSTESNKLKPFLLFLIAKSNLYKGNISDGIQKLKQVINDYPLSQESVEAQNIYNSISENKNIKSADALVGVILPLFSGEISKQGTSTIKEILEGIKFAFSQYNRKNNPKIGLVIRDTKRDRTTIEDISNEFEGIPGLNMVIGPVFSEEVLMAAKAFDGSNIKIISPTATDNALTVINKNVFQANPSFEVRGKTMADYVYFIDKRSRLAVLSSNTGYSSSLAVAFIDEFKKIGGEIFDYEIYPSKSIEITQQTDRLNLYRDTLEAIYAPISDKNDAPVILSSLVLDSLYVPMYGNQDWYGVNGMGTSTALSENFTLTSDYYINFNDQQFKSLSKNFLDQTGKDINRNVLYGYDLAKYLLDILDQSKNDPEKAEILLRANKTGKGFHNNFQFDEENVNKYLNILRFQNGSYKFVERFKAIN